MYKNVSKNIDISPYKDMTKRIKNNAVLVEEFMFEVNDLTPKYDKFTHYTMIHDIRLSLRLGWRILRKSLGYAENVNTISGSSSHEYDTNISQSLSAGLQNCQSINVVKIVGAIINPLCKCDERMIEAGLHNDSRYSSVSSFGMAYPPQEFGLC